ncbi:hypothetical protein [Micromonospora sp. NPDC023814]|uniref:hypothetical protein n=1 Tax=Micromonospora sp. NPDC023814 TaxID=3154596 RepID=UPI0033CB6F6B
MAARLQGREVAQDESVAVVPDGQFDELIGRGETHVHPIGAAPIPAKTLIIGMAAMKAVTSSGGRFSRSTTAAAAKPNAAGANHSGSARMPNRAPARAAVPAT